jgi:hypothetical protein
VKAEGLPGLFRGLCCSWMRNGAWNGTYFGCIFGIKKQINGSPAISGVLSNEKAKNFVAGSIAEEAINTSFGP